MQHRTIDDYYRTTVVVWGVFFLSQFTFIFIMRMVRPEIFRFDFSAPLVDKNVLPVAFFLFLAFINLILSFVIKRRCFDQAIAGQEPRLVQTGLVIACAFCEAIALFGFILGYVFSYPYFFVWFVLAIFGILLHFPRRANLLAAAHRR
jgi:hypothetical protein